MKLTLKIWRQKDTTTAGRFVSYQVDGVTPEMSILEMLDVLNEALIERGDEPPVASEHDCREGICGSCGFLINGVPHGPRRHTTVCQLHMRFFKEGDALTLGTVACAGVPRGQRSRRRPRHAARPRAPAGRPNGARTSGGPPRRRRSVVSQFESGGRWREDRRPAR
jgi:hypothetical protein